MPGLRSPEFFVFVCHIVASYTCITQKRKRLALRERRYQNENVNSSGKSGPHSICVKPLAQVEHTVKGYSIGPRHSHQACTPIPDLLTNLTRHLSKHLWSYDQNINQLDFIHCRQLFTCRIHGTMRIGPTSGGRVPW